MTMFKIMASDQRTHFTNLLCVRYPSDGNKGWQLLKLVRNDNNKKKNNERGFWFIEKTERKKMFQ